MGTEEEVEEARAGTQSYMWNCCDRDPRGTSDGVVKSIFKQGWSFYTKTIDQILPLFKYTVFPFSAHCLSVKIVHRDNSCHLLSKEHLKKKK